MFFLQLASFLSLLVHLMQLVSVVVFGAGNWCLFLFLFFVFSATGVCLCCCFLQFVSFLLF